jgi:hypothetical protein
VSAADSAFRSGTPWFTGLFTGFVTRMDESAILS